MTYGLDNLPGLEVIGKYQHNDWWVKAMNDLHAEYKPKVKRLMSNKKNQKRLEKMGKEYAAKVSDLVYKRFGIPIDGVVLYWYNAAVIPAYTLEGPFSRIIDTIRSMMLKDIDIKDMLKTIKRIQSKLKYQDVVIDLDKLYIKNLNKKDIVFPLLLSFDILADDDMKPDYITAIIAHEIGHLFTYISNSYRVANTVVSVLESLLEEIANAKSTNTLVIKRSDMTREGKIDKNIMEFKNAMEDVIVNYNVNRLALFDPNSFIITVIKHTKLASNPDMAFLLERGEIPILLNLTPGDTSAEQQADEFATRLGLGASLAKALAILYQLGEDKFLNITYSVLFSLFLGFIKTILVLFLAAVIDNLIFNTPLLSIDVQITFKIFVLTIILTLILNTLSAGLGMNDPIVIYDKPYYRIEMLKRDLIKVLKDRNIPTEVKKSILKQIDEIEDVIKKHEKELKSLYRLLATLGRAIFPDGTYKDPGMIAKTLLQQLDNNEFYIIAAKAEILLKEMSNEYRQSR